MVTANVAAPTTTSVPALRHPLRERNFRLFFTGAILSAFGDKFYFVALPWLVLQQTGSAIAMGTIMMTAAIPRTVLMLMGGAVSDRISPRRIMIRAAWVRASLVAAVGFLVWGHFLQTWELYVLAAMFGTADAFDGPALEAYMPSLVQSEQLVAASSAAEVGSEMNSIFGPTVAGFVVKVAGIASAFFVDAVSFLFMIGALLLLPDPPAAKEEKKPIWQSIVQGLKYVGKDVPLRTLLLLGMGLTFCFSAPVSLGLAYVAKTQFGTASMLGLMLTTLSAGALGGAILAGIWKVRHRGYLILFIALVLGLALGSLGLLTSRWTFCAALLVIGITLGMVNVHIGALIMQRIDPSVRGRVTSVFAFGSYGTLPISLTLAGVLISVSVKFMFLLAGSGLLLVTLIAATQKTFRQIQ
jgi:MFS family permease